MTWSEITTLPLPKTLRQFAGLWILFFTGLAFWRGFLDGNPVLGWLLIAVAFTVGPIGLVRPRLLGPIFVGWMIVVFPIGWLVAHMFLAIVFYGLFTPIGFFFRLRGRDALAIRPKPEQETYWMTKPAAKDSSDYFRQF